MIMNRFINVALVLFASVAVAQCGGYGAAPYGGAAGPAVQQVSLGSLANLANIGSIQSYLGGGHGSGHASAGGYGHHGSTSWSPAKYVVAPAAAAAGPVSASGFSAAPAVSHGYGAPAASHGYGAPAVSHGYAAPAISHGYAAPAPVYAAPAAPAYAAPAAAGYGGRGYGAAAPKYTVLPAHVSEINAGKNTYKTYQSGIRFSTVALPVNPAQPVAKLFVADRTGYGSTGGYGGGAAVVPIGAAY